MFEDRPRDQEVPEGFDLNLSASTQEEAYASIEARLQDAKLRLPEGWDGEVLMDAMADGSVDGELYVLVPDHAHTGSVGFYLNQAFGQFSMGQRYWVSMGARYTIEVDDVIYRRSHGLNQVQTHYQRANETNIAEEDFVFRKEVLPGMRHRYKREAHSVFIRLHWNPENVKPKR